MITVGSASLARGYSAWDHLLDDRPLRAMIGREYPSYAAAARAAHRLLAGTQDRRCAGAPVWILDDEGTGSPYWDDGSVA